MENEVNTEQTHFNKVPKTSVSTRLDANLWSLAINSGVSWQRALEMGVYNELIDKKVMDISELPTNLTFFTKELDNVKKKLVSLAKELAEMQSDDEESENEEDKEEEGSEWVKN